MLFDASTIFVLALTLGIVVLLTWAEVHSRRQQKADTSAGGAMAASPLQPPMTKSRNSQG